MIAEPGRYFAEPGMTLFTRIFGKRVRPNATGADTHYYWISDGAPPPGKIPDRPGNCRAARESAAPLRKPPRRRESCRAARETAT